MKFFATIYPGMNREGVNWYPESVAASWPLSKDERRVWINIEVPNDQALWPEKFEGPVVPAEVVDAPTRDS